MNLQEMPFRVGFRPACRGCGSRVDGHARLFADLDGPPWQAYYCGPCAARLRARTIAYQMADERDARIMASLTLPAFKRDIYNQMADAAALRVNPRII